MESTTCPVAVSNTKEPPSHEVSLNRRICCFTSCLTWSYMLNFLWIILVLDQIWCMLYALQVSIYYTFWDFLLKKWRRLVRGYTQNSTSRSTRERDDWILLAMKIKASIPEERLRNPVWPSSFVTPAGVFTSLTSWINGMSTHAHTHTHTVHDWGVPGKVASRFHSYEYDI